MGVFALLSPPDLWPLLAFLLRLIRLLKPFFEGRFGAIGCADGRAPPGSAWLKSWPTDFGMPRVLWPAAAALMARRCFSLTGGMWMLRLCGRNCPCGHGDWVVGLYLRHDAAEHGDVVGGDVE